MPTPTIELHVWIQECTEEDKQKVESLLENSGFTIASHHKPDDRDVEYISHPFEENEQNDALIDDLEDEFDSEFASRNIVREDGPLRDSHPVPWFEALRLEPETDPDLHLIDVDLSGTEFADLDTSQPVPRDIFAGADLTGADLSDSILRRADFSRTTLRDANLSDAYLREADFSDVAGSGIVLTNADLQKANLAGANFPNGGLSQVNLARANLSGANFSNADLSGASLRLVDIDSADFTGVNLTDAEKHQAEFDMWQSSEKRSVPSERGDPTIKNEREDELVCPDCGGQPVDIERGDKVCPDCGLIVAKNEAERGKDTESTTTPEWRAFDTRNESSTSTNSSHNKSMSADEDWSRIVQENTKTPDPPEGPIMIAVTNNAETVYDFYQVEDPGEFFGEAWGDDNEIRRMIFESDKEPDETVEGVHWVTK